MAEPRDIERRRSASERRFAAVFRSIPAMVAIHSLEAGRVLDVNDAFLGTLGYAEEEVLGHTLSELETWVDPEAGDRMAATLASGGAVRGQEAHLRTRDGGILDGVLSAEMVTIVGRSHILWVFTDLTENRRAEDAVHRELEHRAFHDSLTGLPNRALFRNRVEHVHERLAQSSSLYAVLLFDIDGFTTVNESIGHDRGDEVLREVACRLAAGLRPGDTAARLGGDEFGLVLEDLEDEAEAVAAADRLLVSLREPYPIAGRTVTLAGATVGIGVSDGAAAVAGDVVGNAEAALHAGKASGKNCRQLFSHQSHAAALGRLTLHDELREGIRRGELVLRYQPKVDSWSGRVVAVEALVRWNHPVRGLLAPDTFIALAEETGLIVDLDSWVLENACRQASAWARSGGDALSVAVNVSGRTLERGGLPHRLRRVLAETGLDPRLLEVEITEGAALEQKDEALSVLHEIRALGIRIAIDDFGTGYSMLSRLQDFPVDTLKIDRSFISRITDLAAESPIVAATVAMGRGLGLEVVAEGVETEQQRWYLVRQGCERLQGFLISPPVEPERITAMLLTPPVPPLDDTRRALQGATGAAATASALENLAPGLLLELQRLTGLDSVHLTRNRGDGDGQEILFSTSVAAMNMAEEHTSAAEPRSPVQMELLRTSPATAATQQTSACVPVRLSDGTIFGTLRGVSASRTPLGQPALEVMRIFAGLIGAQVTGPTVTSAA